MGNNVEFRIFIAGMEKFGSDLKKGSDRLEDFSKVTKELSRELGQVGTILTGLGASMSGPLLLAFRNSAKVSAEVAEQTKRLSAITTEFQKVIAVGIVPVMTKFNDVLANLFNAFNALDPGVRNMILQGTLLSGVFLTMGGILTIITAKFLSLASNVAGLTAKLLLLIETNPGLLAMGVSIIALTFLMVRFKGIADIVLTTYQILFTDLQIGFLSVGIVFEKTIANMLAILTNFSDVIGKIPSVLGVLVRDFSEEIKDASNALSRMAEQDLEAVNIKIQELSDILAGNRHEWADGFHELKESVQEFFAVLGQPGGDSPVGTFVQGFNEGLEQIKIKFNDIKAIGASVATSLHSNLSTAFSSIILGVKSAKEAFQDFGKAMLKAIVDFIAQWLAFQLISRTLGVLAAAFSKGIAAQLALAWAKPAALASLATLGGNAVPAAAGISSTFALANALAVFARGSSGIKDDTLGLFNKHEIVIPASFSEGIRRGDLSLSGGGGGSGFTIDLRGSTFNGITDDLVEKIFTKASENINNRTLNFRGA